MTGKKLRLERAQELVNMLADLAGGEMDLAPHVRQLQLQLVAAARAHAKAARAADELASLLADYGEPGLLALARLLRAAVDKARKG